MKKLAFLTLVILLVAASCGPAKGPEPEINSFTASPPCITAPDGCATLTWDATDVETVAISEGDQLPVSPDDLTVPPSTWTEMVSGTSTINLRGVWSSGEYNAFAVGLFGTLLHYDGSDWISIPSGTMKHLNAVWGDGGNHVIAVGDDGTVIRSDDGGVAWATVTPRPTTEDLMDVWGDGGNYVVAVGDDGTVIWSDNGGVAWATVTPRPTTEDLSGVWGDGGNHVIAVGDDGVVIWTDDGATWDAVTPPPTGDDLSGVWGDGGNHVVAVGDDGTVIRSDDGGATWTAITAGSAGDDLSDVWGHEGGGNIYAVGNGGTILVSTNGGVAWTTMQSDTMRALNDVYGSSGGCVFAVGAAGTILHYCHCVCPGSTGFGGTACDGTGWEELDSGTNLHLTDVWVLSDNDAFAVGGGWTGGSTNSLILRYDGANWSPTITGVTVSVPFHGVWAEPSGQRAYAVAVNGNVCRHDSSGWSNKVLAGGVVLDDVWGSSADHIIAVGGTYNESNIWLSNDDGTTWSERSSGAWPRLHDVCGSSAQDIVAVANGGTTLWSGNGGDSWTEASNPTSSNLQGVWAEQGTGLVIAVGTNGTILRSTDFGRNWQLAADSGTYSATLNDVWGNSASRIFAVGSGGTIIKSTDGGHLWAQMGSPTGVTLHGVSGEQGGCSVFIVGDTGTVLHYPTQAGGTDYSSGCAVVSPDETTAYALTTSNAAGNDTETVTVWVGKPTVTPVASPLAVTQGNPATLDWTVSNAETWELQPGGDSGTLPDPSEHTVSQTVTPDNTTTYVLTAANPCGSATGEVEVTVGPLPVISLDITPPCVLPGDAPLVWLRITGLDVGDTWRLQCHSPQGDLLYDHVRVTMYGGAWDMGYHPLSVVSTCTFTLTATNAWGSTTETVTAWVDGPDIVDFIAYPQPVHAGECLHLKWDVFNTETASITPDPGVGILEPDVGSTDIYGSTEVCPVPCPDDTGKIYYQLTASNPCGSESITIAVEVLPPDCPCPAECECMTWEEAEQRGCKDDQCRERPCACDDNGKFEFCFKTCPVGCTCLTKAEAISLGLSSTQCTDQACGVDDFGEPKYCFRTCDKVSGCDCMLADKAKQAGYDYCCREEPCTYDAHCDPWYCFREAPDCDTGCECLTESEALQTGFVKFCSGELCRCSKEPCGRECPGPEKYCFSRCMQGCVCLTEAEAAAQNLSQLCSDAPCGKETMKAIPLTKMASVSPSEPPQLLSIPKYCYRICPEGCECLTDAQADSLGFGWCTDASGKKIPCEYDVDGEPTGHCYEVGQQPSGVCPKGCECLPPAWCLELALEGCPPDKPLPCGEYGPDGEPTKVCCRCPNNCWCLPEDEAEQFDLAKCSPPARCSEPGQPNKRCYTCPTWCECKTETWAQDLGYTPVQCYPEPCGVSVPSDYSTRGVEQAPEAVEQQAPLPVTVKEYCYAVCPEGCACMTLDELGDAGCYTGTAVIYNKLCIPEQCGVDVHGDAMYCCPKQEEPPPPPAPPAGLVECPDVAGELPLVEAQVAAMEQQSGVARKYAELAQTWFASPDVDITADIPTWDQLDSDEKADLLVSEIKWALTPVPKPLEVACPPPRIESCEEAELKLKRAQERVEELSDAMKRAGDYCDFLEFLVGGWTLPPQEWRDYYEDGFRDKLAPLQDDVEFCAQAEEWADGKQGCVETVDKIHKVSLD